MDDLLQLKVAEEVRVVMTRQCRSQTEVAKALGQPQQWLWRRLSGRTPFSVSEFIRIADFLGVEVTDLLPPKVAA